MVGSGGKKEKKERMDVQLWEYVYVSVCVYVSTNSG